MPDPNRPETPPAVLERASELGLPCWRVTTDGVVVEEPSLTGPAGLWFRSGPVERILEHAVRMWNACESPEPIEVAAGFWLLPLPETRRRKRAGYTVMATIGPAIFETGPFETVCAAARLDRHVTRQTLRPLASFTEAESMRLARTLAWMAEDQRAVAKHEHGLSGFTTQLGESYETISALYGVGRTMHQVAEPANFLRSTVTSLFETLAFGWVACRIADDPKLPARIRGRVFHVGAHGCAEDEFESVLTQLKARVRAEATNGKAMLINAVGEIPEPLGPQIVAQPIRRDGVQYGVVFAGSKGGYDPAVSTYDTLLLEAAAGFLMAFLENVALYEQQRATFMGTIRAMTAAIDAKDRYTRGHSERVAFMSRQLALASGLAPAEADRIHVAALIHDVGKIGVPERVLCKPGRLTDEEFELIKLHPEIGRNILQDIPTLADCLPGVLHHHERWDGRGYPHGLAGEDIPLIARIIGLADTFDAMSSSRSYRSAMPREKVLAEIERCAGSQFDPGLVPAFLTIALADYDAMVERHRENTFATAAEDTLQQRQAA
jgi:HD-GYP domain-containing protein (c-di-GMP phosphodiesterase class II)